MTGLADLQATIDQARAEVRALRKALANARVSVSQAGRDGAGEPELQAVLTAQRVDRLREVETSMLSRLEELRAIEREPRAVLAGGLGLAISDAERAQAAQLASIHGDTDAMPLTDIHAALQAAVLHGDRGSMYFWAHRARGRLLADGPRFGGDTRLPDWDEASGRARAALDTLVGEVTQTLQDRSADPVLEAADGLRDAAVDLRGVISTARANRGEGPQFGDPRVRTVKIPGHSLQFDVTGYEQVGMVGYSDS